MKKLSFILQLCLLLALLFLFLMSQWKYVNKKAYTYHNKFDTASTGLNEKIQPQVNLNTADFQTLMSIPTMNKKIANSILQYRELHGDFIYPEDIIYIKGIGEKTLEKIIEFLYVE